MSKRKYPFEMHLAVVMHYSTTNACAECFFGTLKSECFYTRKFNDVDELKVALEDYIRYYNTRRISLKFNGLSPIE